MRQQLTVGLVASLLAFGCGDDDDTMSDMDGGPLPIDASDVDLGTDSGVDSGMTTGDGNDSFDTATPATLGTAIEDGVIDPAGDLDYYSFEGEAGQWIAITTSANPDDDPEMVDTVLTLFDSSMTQIAENDDSIPRTDTDSEIFTRLPSAGTYYVLVQEFSTWADDTPEGMESFAYELLIAEIDPDAVAVTLDAEGGDDVGSAQTLRYNVSANGDFGLLIGELRDGSDVDVFSFNVSDSKPFPRFTVLPSGSDGNGSSAMPSAVWVTDAAGTEIIGRIDPSALQDLSPGVPTGEYRLWVEHGGSAGANDFYTLKAFRFTSDNPPEMNDTLNDVAATAETLTLEDDDEDGIFTAFVLAQVGDGDTDFFSIDVTDAAHVVSVFCGSRSAGSGVIDLEAALTDATGVTLIDSATESATEGLALEEVAVSAAGTHLVRLTKDSQDGEVTGTWARCGVAVGPPAP